MKNKKSIVSGFVFLIGTYIVHECAREIAVSLYEGTKAIATDKKLKENIAIRMKQAKNKLTPNKAA